MITQDEIRERVRREASEVLAKSRQRPVNRVQERLDGVLDRITALHPQTKTASGRIIRTGEIRVKVEDAGRSVAIGIELRGEFNQLFCERSGGGHGV